jgi:predicted metalloprotease
VSVNGPDFNSYDPPRHLRNKFGDDPQRKNRGTTVYTTVALGPGFFRTSGEIGGPVCALALGGVDWAGRRGIGQVHHAWIRPRRVHSDNTHWALRGHLSQLGSVGRSGNIRKDSLQASSCRLSERLCCSASTTWLGRKQHSRPGKRPATLGKVTDMRWTPGGSSDDVEDHRDDSGGGGGFRVGGLHIGLGGVIILFVLSLIFKRDFLSLLSSGPAGTTGTAVTQRDPARDQREQPLVQFVTFVLNDTQNTWSQILPSQGAQYHHAKLVLFRDSIDSACGLAQSATGPFYCPEDEKVYIDLGFYDELKQRFGAPGEFAEAYVLAHEIGHHVQKLLGIEGKVQAARQQNPQEANQLSVRLELQADCFAGVWGHSTQQRNILEAGDVDAGLKAAAAVGDDRLQRMSRGTVNPESFTHGSSAQRTEWFQRGFQDGTIASCNTFQ